MIRWSKTRSVARFELKSTIRRTGYLVITLGMPVFAVLYAALALIPGYLVSRQAAHEKRYGLVDESHALGVSPGQELVAERVRFVVHDSEASARASLGERREIKGYYVLPADYLATGTIQANGPSQASGDPWEARGELAMVIRRRLLAHSLSDRMRARVLEPVKQRETYRIGEDGRPLRERREAFLGRLVLPIGFVLLLFSSILMSGSYLIQATATEKENKVIEVLLSSATADEIMTGKLLGLGGAGLIQVFTWLTMTLGVRVAFVYLLTPFDVRVPWQALALSPVLFLAAYAFLGSLMLGTGSFGGNVRESQQLGMLWGLLATVPLMFLPVILNEPHSLSARILTWIPFSAPATLVFRMSLDPTGVPLWEIVGAIGLLLLSTVGALWLSSRLFRIGLMLSGPRPPLREILRQARGEAARR